MYAKIVDGINIIIYELLLNKEYTGLLNMSEKESNSCV